MLKEVFKAHDLVPPTQKLFISSFQFYLLNKAVTIITIIIIITIEQNYYN